MSPVNHSDRWLSIVGIGEDGMAGLSPLAAAVVAGAELLVGGARHLAMVPDGAAERPAERLAWPSPLTDAIGPIRAARGRRVVVLASGDPFLWGVGATLARFIPPEEIACHPAPSSFSLAAARLGWAQQDCALISLHGRPFETLVPHVQPQARILALTWDGRTAAKAAARLSELGFGSSRLTVLERIGASAERIRSVWSRERAGSQTSTSTPPDRPARRSALLICALALGERYWKGRSAPPRSSTGSRSAFSISRKAAPIAESGSVTRRIGRERSDASPVSVAVSGRPARSPIISRAVVPLFPQSRISAG